MLIRKKQRCLSITLALASAGVSANPTGAQIAHGNVSMETAGAVLNITNSPNAIINWQDFSINAGELTRFLQENAGSAVLNRVTGGSVSEILGQLQSNGRVFLINPNGLVIGNGASIDTAGFVGSTLNISDDDFLSGRFHFQGNGGKIVNRGYIRAADNGEVVLIAPDIENGGVIEARNGEIILAAGREVTLTSLDHEHISFRVQAPGDKALNLGRLIATNGAVGLFAGTVQQRGEIAADRVGRGADGSIILQARSTVDVSGSLSARGSAAQGGDIRILGDTVNIKGASIDASGDAGGGQILMGGDYQGQGATPTARRTRIDGASHIRADALRKGNGGRIIAWSETTTTTDGYLSARGGPAGGDGGFVETSGKGKLDFSRPVDVSAPGGKPGTWLLDPQDINIDGGRAASINATLNNGGNVSVKTSDNGSGQGNIAVNAPISKTSGGDAALSMQAHNRIDVNAPISSTSGKLHVSLKAGRAVGVHAPVTTNGGSFSTRITGVAPPKPKPDDKPANKPADDRPAATETHAQNDQGNQAGQSQAPGQNNGTSHSNDGGQPQHGPDSSAEAAASETDAATAAGLNPPPETVNAPASTPDSAPAPAAAEAAANPLPAPEPVAAPPVPASQPANAPAASQPAPSPASQSAPGQTASAPPASQAPGSAAASVAGGNPSATQSAPAAAPPAPQEVVIDADIHTDGGAIHVDAGEQGTVYVRANVDSSTEKSGQKGGDIALLGDRVGVFDDSRVDASGSAGGGQILVGGDRQGQNPDVRNASAVYIGENAVVRSDAMNNGDGGKVIVFAQDTANILGNISARGGVGGGNGGFVETSGKSNLVIQQTPDVSAPNGRAGAWLIDPYNIEIRDSANMNVGNSGTAGPCVDDTCFQPTNSGAILDVATIYAGLTSGTNVTITTSAIPGGTAAPQQGNILWAADLDLDGVRPVTNVGAGTIVGSPPGSLTLQAHNDIIMQGSIFDSDNSSSVDDRLTGLILTADQDNSGSGDIVISGDSGAVRIDVAGDIRMTAENLDIHGGTGTDQGVDINADGDIGLGIAKSAVIRGGDAGLSNRVDIRAGSFATPGSFIYSSDGTKTGGRGGELTLRGGNMGESNRVNIDASEVFINASKVDIHGGDLSKVAPAMLPAAPVAADSRDNFVQVGGGALTIESGEVLLAGGDQGIGNSVLLYSGDTNIVVDDALGAGFGNLVIRGGGSDTALGLSDTTSRYNSAVIDGTLGSSQISVTTAGNVRVEAGSYQRNDARLGGSGGSDFTGPIPDMTLNIAGALILGGDNQQADAEIAATRNQTINVGGDIHFLDGASPSRIVVNNIDNNVPVSQTIHADGNININGSDGGDSVIEISSRVSPFTTNTGTVFDVTATQDVSAGGNLSIRGKGTDSFTGIQLDLEIDSSALSAGVTHHLNATQTVTAANALSITGGDAEGSVAGITMTGSSTGPNGATATNSFNLDQEINAQALNLTAGARANANAVIALNLTDASGSGGNGSSSQTVSVAGALGLQGRDLPGVGNAKLPPGALAAVAPASGASAVISTRVSDLVQAADQIISAGSLSMQGMSNNIGTRATAQIVHDGNGVAGSRQDITVAGDVLMRGEDADARANIESTGKGGRIAVGGDLTMENTAAAAGPGRNAATRISLAGNMAVSGKTTLKGATLEGDGDIATSGFDWAEGRIRGAGKLDSTGAATISTNGEKQLLNRSWNNQGAAQWSGGDVALGDAVINNSGSLVALADNALLDITVGSVNNSVFNNTGDFSKQNGAGDTRIESGIAFNNSGNVSADSGNIAFDGGFRQSAGNTDLSGGNISSGDTQGIRIEGGSLTGAGTVGGDLNVALPAGSNAMVAPGHSPGTLNVAGNLNIGSGGTLNMEAAGTGAGQYDQIKVGGDAALNGAINLTFINGYAPASGDSYRLVSARANSGNFNAFNPGAVAAGLSVKENYNPADYTVDIQGRATTPQPTDPGRPVIPVVPTNPQRPVTTAGGEPVPGDDGRTPDGKLPPRTGATPGDILEVPDSTPELVTLLEQLPVITETGERDSGVPQCTALTSGAERRLPAGEESEQERRRKHRSNRQQDHAGGG